MVARDEQYTATNIAAPACHQRVRQAIVQTMDAACRAVCRPVPHGCPLQRSGMSSRSNSANSVRCDDSECHRRCKNPHNAG
jgi:hypothetical protein